MKKYILFLPVAVLLVLMVGLTSGVLAYAGDVKCEARYFDAEKGCQVPLAMEYEKEKAGTMQAATIMGCPERYFDSEKGCQVQRAYEYETEYALVKEAIGDEIIRGCPSRYFDAEKGCQVPTVYE